MLLADLQGTDDLAVFRFGGASTALSSRLNRKPHRSTSSMGSVSGSMALTWKETPYLSAWAAKRWRIVLTVELTV